MMVMLRMIVSSKALCIVFRMLYHTRQRKKISICGKESDLCNQMKSSSSRQSSSQSPLLGRSWLPKRNRANFILFLSSFFFFLLELFFSLSPVSLVSFLFSLSRYMYEFQRPANFPAIRYTIVRRINEQRQKQKDTERFLSSSYPSNGLPSPPVDHDDMFKQEETTTTTTTCTTTLPTSTLAELSGTPSSGNSCASSPRESQHAMDEKAIRDKIQELQNEKHELFQLMKNLLAKQQQQQQQEEIQQQQQQQQQTKTENHPPSLPSSSHSSSSLSSSKAAAHPVVSTSSTSSSRSSSSERSPSPQTPPVQEQSQKMPPLTSLSSSSQHNLRSSSLDHHRSFPPHPPPPRYMPYHRRPPPLAPPRYYSSRYGGSSGGRPMNGFSSPSYPVSRHKHLY